jgi:hypothetical protein
VTQTELFLANEAIDAESTVKPGHTNAEASKSRQSDFGRRGNLRCGKLGTDFVIRDISG